MTDRNDRLADVQRRALFAAEVIVNRRLHDFSMRHQTQYSNDVATERKAIEAELEGSHAHIGAEFARRFGEIPVIVNAIAAHHEEVKPESLYAGIVILADTLSAVRPGARAESMAAYIERLQRLEKIALDLPGVQSAYAIQAGREVRVVVAPGTVGDDAARELARQIRQRIEDELQYPSTIKVTVIREQRYTELAT